MMRFFLLFVIVALLIFFSCDLQTVQGPGADEHPADHLVINEVFTLPPSVPDPYSWIEFLNPTDKPIFGLSKYTVTYTSRIGPVQTRKTFPLAIVEFVTGAVVDTLQPGAFVVIMTDSIRFYNHTNLGAGQGIVAVGPVFRQYRQDNGVVFALAESDELVLRDTSGRPIDVVRYGNYVSPAPPDSFAANHSAGMIPEWSSLSRYANGYSTGNSANDFYMEAKPIPMWYSELHHP